jgi:hypothetical protein
VAFQYFNIPLFHELPRALQIPSNLIQNAIPGEFYTAIGPRIYTAIFSFYTATSWHRREFFIFPKIYFCSRLYLMLSTFPSSISSEFKEIYCTKTLRLVLIAPPTDEPASAHLQGCSVKKSIPPHFMKCGGMQAVTIKTL